MKGRKCETVKYRKAKATKKHILNATGAVTSCDKLKEGTLAVVVPYERNIPSPKDIYVMKSKSQEQAAEVSLFIRSTYNS